MRLPPELLDAFQAPYLPSVGDVYLVNTDILDAVDVHPRRPAVVIEVPAEARGRIHVVARTRELWRPGIPHPAEPELELHEGGVFAYLRHTDAYLWKRENASYLGVLDTDTLDKVLDWFG